jgi:hypothetical protein
VKEVRDMQDMQDMFEKEVPYIVEKKRELRLLNNLWIKILCCFTIFVFIYTIKLINNEASRKLMVVIKDGGAGCRRRYCRLDKGSDGIKDTKTGFISPFFL